jgi:hypothetical protein
MTKLSDIYPTPTLATVRQVLATQADDGTWSFRADADCASSVLGAPAIHVEATGVVSPEASAPLVGLVLAAVLPAITAKLYAPDNAE